MERRRINTRAIVWRNGKILAVKHKNSDYENGETPYWALPGGGLDPLETLQDGVKREVMEELGVTADVGNLLFIQQFKSKREEFDEELEFFFHVHDSTDFDSIDLSKTTHGLEELSRVEFIDPKLHPIKPTFLAAETIEAAVMATHPVYIGNGEL